MINIERLANETLDEYIDRIISEELRENEIERQKRIGHEEYVAETRKKLWKKWVRLSGVPCGKKMAKKRRNAIIRYMEYTFIGR